MKKTLLFVALMVISSVSSFAQSDSDDPIYNNLVPTMVPVSLMQPVISAAKTITVGPITIDGEILLCDSTSTTLVATNGTCGYSWFSDSLGANVISSASTLPLSGLSGDTVVYVSEAIAAFDSLLPLPPHGSVFSGNVRGYWFQAPADMIITAATVPTEASTGLSNIAIVKFDTAAPPLWPGTTNAFIVLGLWQNEVADTVFLCAPVDSGEWIGVLGNRGDANSYAGAPYNSSILGIPTQLSRMGMQFPLSSTAPQDIFYEAGGSISRVKLIYGSPTSVGPIYPVPLSAPQSTSDSINMSICNGDSTLLGGAMQTVGGIYVDSLTSISGCDSIVSTTLTIEPAVDGSATQAGFVLTATNATGTYQWVDCNNGNAAISGATSQSYTATANGSYAVQVTVNGCSAMSACFDYTTIGIDEYDLGTAFSIYPNPTLDIVNYTFNGSMTMDFVLTNVAGKVIWSGTSSTNEGTIDLGAYAAGTYLLDVSNGDKRATIRLIKK